MGRFGQVIITVIGFFVFALVLMVPLTIIGTRPYAMWQFENVVCKETESFYENDRIDCFPEYEKPTYRQCLMRGCCWRRVNWDKDQRIPECYLPSNIGYRVIGEEQGTNLGFYVDLKRLDSPPFFDQPVMEFLRFQVEYQKENRLHLKIFQYRYVERQHLRVYYKYQEEEDHKWRHRFEIPLEYPREERMVGFRDYEVNYTRNPFTIKITRPSSGGVLFDTGIGGFIFEEQFIQFSTLLQTTAIFGFGEHRHKRLRHWVLDWPTWGMWTTNADPEEDSMNLHGQHPFYIGIEPGGDAHGVYFANSNAQEVAIIPLPALTWRTIGGIVDLYFYTGPSPESVVAQHTEVTGRSSIPPYWALGYHMGREDFDSVAGMQELVDRNLEANVPFDVLYTGLEITDSYRMFTYDETQFDGLPEFAQMINDTGRKLLITMTPGVPKHVPEPKTYYHPLYYLEKYGLLVNISNTTTRPVTVHDWAGEVVIPDYTNPLTRDWLASYISLLHDQFPFHGIIITDNEPSNFVNGSKMGCQNRKLNFPPYVPKLQSKMLYQNTICMESRYSLGDHYDIHSLFGLYSSEAFYMAMTEVFHDQRTLLLSRATAPGTGRYAGYWLGKNHFTWDDLRYSLITMLEFNLFGVPMVGPNICGYYDNDELTPSEKVELCTRWIQASSLFPMARFYRGKGQSDADPASWGEPLLGNVRKAIETRYSLLPYIYTLFYHAHLDGFTVARPIFNEFPYEDRGHTWDVDWEFLLGPAILVAPAMEPTNGGSTPVSVYIPDDRFYNYHTGVQVPNGQKGTNITVNIPIDDISMHMRGGYIIPTQKPGNMTYHSRMNDMELVVALSEGDLGVARGDLFWDDGESFEPYKTERDLLLEFFADSNRIDIFVQRYNLLVYKPEIELPIISSIRFFGRRNDPGTRVTVDHDELLPEQINYDVNTRVLLLTGLTMDIKSDHVIEIGATSLP
ncbi:Maltase-glucoamylase, intestinal [Holothuria leucospilota]|uniref:Maltase n=1 Tax=Holothuria leucospilota TaxID=206669 RepID=A0A9Q1BQB6_HOLLE|nr:Maltase-glucoamylase, intestinal [Holothuria leucospilota]